MSDRPPAHVTRPDQPQEEWVDVVDEQDRVVRQAPRSEVRAHNLLHRCVAILCRNGAGAIYVHRRTDTKDVFPGMYDAFVGGVVGAGERYDDAARREIAEELGIVGPTPRYLFTHRYEGPESRSFTATYDVRWDGPIRHQESEVAWGDHLTPEQVWDRMRGPDPWPFVPDGLEIYDAWRAREENPS